MANIAERIFRPSRIKKARQHYEFGKIAFNQGDNKKARAFFKQAVRGQEKTLGKEHTDTLNSKHWLARTLYEQEKYSEAEVLFQQMVQGQERVLGKEHTNTLNSKYWLAHTFYIQKKYSKAKVLFQQTVQGQERVLGKEHTNTLDSKHWLAHTLYILEEYSEAEVFFQQMVQGKERVLGGEHTDTLNTKYWLARTLCKQEKYSEAEVFFQQMVQGKERVLGKEHTNTLDSKHWLARTLYILEEYSKAEVFFQQIVQGQERVLGGEHTDTLDTKYWLARTLCKQEKYSEAEVFFQQTVQGRERVLGKKHTDTLYSKYWLAHTLYKQKKDSKSEENRGQARQGQEDVPGSDSASFHAREHFEPHTANCQKASPGRLEAFFKGSESDWVLYTDTDIMEISRLLKLQRPRWSIVPRTYIVLRNIRCLDMLDELLDLGFSDFLIPITIESAPHCLRPSQRLAFVKAQRLIMTQSMDLERGQHCFFQQGDSLPFEIQKRLGAGSSARVDQVLSLISSKTYARKRIARKNTYAARTPEAMKQLVVEIQTLKRLDHVHVVEFVGSYTDPKYIGLIMSPVAEMDLSTYLGGANEVNRGELRTFFGCLAKALEYLHENKVRHKDIKPQNILVNHGNVLLTDFGLARDFTGADGSTTFDTVIGCTPRYCAPEVAMMESRNTASDIWSLGVVFLEMTIVLKGRTVKDMYDFFKAHGSHLECARTNRAALSELVKELAEVRSPLDNSPLEWVEQMLQANQQLRPTSGALLTSILGTSGNNPTFCGACCSPPDSDDDSFLM